MTAGVVGKYNKFLRVFEPTLEKGLDIVYLLVIIDPEVSPSTPSRLPRNRFSVLCGIVERSKVAKVDLANKEATTRGTQVNG